MMCWPAMRAARFWLTAGPYKALAAGFDSQAAYDENWVRIRYYVTMSDDVVALAKLVVRQSALINLMSLQLADQACLIRDTISRCEKCRSEPSTVRHVHVGLHLCDRCAAESIVKSGRAYVDSYIADPEDPLNVVRSSLMNENDWVDMPDADKVRRIADYVKIIKELEVTPDMLQ